MVHNTTWDMQGDDVMFACLGAGAQLLKPGDNTAPLCILGHKATAAHRWRHDESGKLVNKASGKQLPLDARLLNIYATDEICRIEKGHRARAAQMDKEVSFDWAVVALKSACILSGLDPWRVSMQLAGLAYYYLEHSCGRPVAAKSARTCRYTKAGSASKGCSQT